MNYQVSVHETYKSKYSSEANMKQVDYKKPQTQHSKQVTNSYLNTEKQHVNIKILETIKLEMNNLSAM